MPLEPSLNGQLIGRGTSAAPTNRFERLGVVADWEHILDDPEGLPGERKVPTQFFVDGTKTILVENDSPDISFRWSINPYRGCEHGCAYCYARPYHEYLGMNAGVDFETKILVKEQAPKLLRDELNKPSWKGEQAIAISGVTDCYQPAERKFRITRGLIEVLSEARQAFGLITKNALITRDLDLLGPLGGLNLVHANISITTLDAELARALEPRTSPPAKRLDAIRQLSAAGVPVRVMVAPIIPGLNDMEIPAILREAAAAGAKNAAYTLLRLPFAVKEIFLRWVDEFRPNLRARVEGHIRATRGGELTGTEFGERMRGTGEYAAQIQQTLKVFAKKYGLDGGMPAYDTTLFRPPTNGAGQGMLF